MLMMAIMSMGRLLFVYILLMDPATRAVNACFLIHLKQRDPHANFSILPRYKKFTALVNSMWPFKMFV